jgi:rod shape-determining protein MreC
MLFILIEFVSLLLLFTSNPYQKFAFYGFSHSISHRISARISNLKDYLSLYDENRKLIEENTELYNQLSGTYPGISANALTDSSDSLSNLYQYIPAHVINNSVNDQFNYMTINKGSREGIEPDMGVISGDGIVGFTKAVSKNFSVILPALNLDFIVSGMIKKNGYYGPVSWEGINTEILTLVDIPHHVSVSEGDTVITSGYGEKFPEGYLIGVVEDFKLKGGNYYEIDVRISTDFRKLHNVQVIRNLALREIDSLQNAAMND